MNHSLISRFTHCHRTTLHHSTVLCRNNAFFLFFTSRFFSVSITNNNQDHSFTLSNLVNSSGLSSELSLKLSKRLQIKNPNGPNAVIQLLRNHGFSESQLCNYVKKHPFVLLSDVENTLLPKLKFLHSIGVSTTDVPKFLIRNSTFLKVSLEKNILPRYRIIRSLVRDDKEVASAMKNVSWNFYNDSMVNDSVPNIEVLRQLGVPQNSISHLVSNYSNVAFIDHYRFVEAVNSVKEMGFNPSKLNFVLALQVFAKINNKAFWESKLKIFERWGWSKDICVFAFQRCPQYILISEEKIIKTMNFLVKDMGLTPEDIARNPNILNRNLEKTIMPRCAVVKILKSRGLIKSSLSISSFIIITEKTFLERYVNPFQKDLPLVLAVYEGQKLD